MKTILTTLLLMTTIISGLYGQCQLPNQINGQKIKEFFVIIKDGNLDSSKLYAKVVNSDISILISDSSDHYKISEHIYNQNGFHIVKLSCGSVIPVKNMSDKYGVTSELDLAGRNLTKSGGLMLGGIGMTSLGVAIGVSLIKKNPTASIVAMGVGSGVGGVMIISGIAKLINGGKNLSKFSQRFDIGYYGTGGSVNIKL